MSAIGLANKAEEAGVQIFAGFPAADVIVEDGQLKGIISGDFVVDKVG